MVWLKSIQRLDITMLVMLLFFLSNANNFITQKLLSFKKDCSRVDWLSIVKTNLKSRVHVVQDGTAEVTAGDDVSQLDELVDPYWVASSIDIEENLSFHVAKNTFVDVNIEELNDVLRTNEYTEVNEDDDSYEINIEDYDGDDNDEIEEDDDDDEIWKRSFKLERHDSLKRFQTSVHLRGYIGRIYSECDVQIFCVVVAV